MGTQGEHLPDAFERLFGLAFLDEAYDGIDHRHSKNHAGVDPVPEKRFRHAGGNKNVNQNIIKVLEKPLKQPFFRRLRKPVWTDGYQPVGGLGGRQAVALAPHFFQHVIRPHCVRIDANGSI